MDYAKFRYYILCEDKAHFHFVRGWLQQKGVSIRKIIEPGYLPLGSCAKAYVQNCYADYKQRICAKAQKENVALIVVMDADNTTVDDACNFFPYEGGQPIFLIIPKWSIDSWARFLTDPQHTEALNENVSCKTQNKYSSWGELGKKLGTLSRADVVRLPSLKNTWQRIAAQKSTLRER